MTDYRPPYKAAVLAGIGAWVLYVLTLSPSTAMWDTSEYIATAYILGIPHPPGNPLFVVLAKSWSLLLAPLGLSVAVRINLLAATTSAMAAGFYFLVAHRILWGFLPGGGARSARPASSRTNDSRTKSQGRKRKAEKAEKAEEAESVEEASLGSTDGGRPGSALPMVGAGVSVLLSATAFTVWNQSTVNEKVYTISVATIAAVVWLVIRWYDRRDEPTGVRYLLGALYLMALGSTNHLMSVLPLPAVAFFVVLVAPGVLLSRTLWTRGITLVIVGLSLNFFLPIRAARDPVLNEGDPTCESAVQAAVAVYTNGRAGCVNLALVLSRFQYQKPPITERQAPFLDQLLNYYQYFDWQWVRGLDPSELPGGGRTPITLLFMILGGWGLWVVWRAHRGAFYLLATLTLTVTLGLVFYLNFKYGYSLAPQIREQTLHEVRERDYFFIVSFGLWGLLAGIGLTAFWRRIADNLSVGRPLLMSAPVLLVALLPLLFNWTWASRAGDYATRDWAYDLLMSVEPYGIIFTNGDNDTFPLWYVQEVEGIRKDVTVVVGQYVYTPWYPKQLQELTRPGRQRPFLPGQAEGLYTAPDSPPADPILTISPDEMDRVAALQTPNDLTVPLGPLVVQYPEGTYLDRADQLVLTMIFDSIDERPIYFATPSGILARLGLEPWAVRQGLAAKLVPRNLEEEHGPDLVKTAEGVGADWFDVPRSLKLLQDTYMYRGFKDRTVWADRSTLNIVWYFYATTVQLADAVSRWGEGTPEEIEALQENAQAFYITALGGRLAASVDTGEG